MTPAVGYLRVSTESQVDGFGLDVQRDAITATAAELGLDLVAVFSDEGISGSEDLSVRVGLADALDALAAGSVLLIPKLDRLARDLIIQEQVLAEAWRTGATVVPCPEAERIYCQPDDPSDPSRRFIRQVLGAVADYERAMIRVRLVGGRRRLLAKTGYAGGPEPYGWSCEIERGVLDDVHAARKRGRAWRAIARDLNAAGRAKRNGQPWSSTELHRTYTRAIERGTLAAGHVLSCP